MAAITVVIEEGSAILTMGEYYAIRIGDATIMATLDRHQANWIARKLNMARESGKHTAMNILTEQLGLSENEALRILEGLHMTHTRNSTPSTLN